MSSPSLPLRAQVKARQIWGDGVYTFDSDLVAVLMHMGYYAHYLSHPPSTASEFRALLKLLPPQVSGLLACLLGAHSTAASPSCLPAPLPRQQGLLVLFAPAAPARWHRGCGLRAQGTGEQCLPARLPAFLPARSAAARTCCCRTSTTLERALSSRACGARQGTAARTRCGAVVGLCRQPAAASCPCRQGRGTGCVQYGAPTTGLPPHATHCTGVLSRPDCTAAATAWQHAGHGFADSCGAIHHTRASMAHRPGAHIYTQPGKARRANLAHACRWSGAG